MSLKSLSNLEIVETARKAYGTRRTRSVAFRTEQLRNLLRLVEENTEEMLLTLKQDMRKSKNEALLFEINYLKIDIKKMIGDLEVFAADDTLPLNLVTPLDNGYLQTEPLGVVLILGAWNYPFLLSIQPMIGAIAAGNVVVLKPSEVALRAAEFMSRRIPEYLDPECYQVIVGDVARTKDLLKHKFDYIFFTGSSSVGTEILAAAALHLTPCTLELGGKSPCYIDDSADFYVAAKRIFWAKCVNLGQTCIAPDYILCSKYAEREFIKTGKEVLLQWYGENPQANPDLPRIINEKHFNRIKKLIDSTTGRIVLGGKTDAKDLWIEPTIIGWSVCL